MDYICNGSLKYGKIPWKANITLFRKTGDFYEAEICSRGTCFHLIAGHYRGGSFLCVPNHGFGCELSDFSDIFWNRERIRKYLNPVDTESLVRGISLLPELK